MSQSTDQIQLDNVDEEDIEKMSDETGLEEDILRSSIESQRADDMYEKVSSESNDEESRQVTEVIRNAVLFTCNTLVRNPQVPKTGEVVNVSPSEVGDYIKLTVESEYPDIPSESVSEDTIKDTFKYSLDSDKEDLDFLMKKAGAEKPSEMMNKRIPISPENRTESRSIDRSTFNMYHSTSTISDKFNYLGERVLLYTKSVERFSKFSSGNGSMRGQWFPNRNVFLSLSLLFGLLQIIFSSVNSTVGFGESLGFFAMCIATLTSFVYGVLVLRGFLYGMADYVTKEPSDRDYIRHIMHK